MTPYKTLQPEEAEEVDASGNFRTRTTLQVKDEEGNLLRTATDVEAAPDVSEWETKEVCEWLESIGLGHHTQEFRRNEIVGRQLHRLTEEHLVAMGVSLIGQRLVLRHEISRLHSEMSDTLDETVVWSASAVKSYHGACDYFYKRKIRPCLRKLTCQLPGFLDGYHMTTSALIVTQRERTLSEVCCGGRQVRTTTRHVEASPVGFEPAPSVNWPACAAASHALG